MYSLATAQTAGEDTNDHSMLEKTRHIYTADIDAHGPSSIFAFPMAMETVIK